MVGACSLTTKGTKDTKVHEGDSPLCDIFAAFVPFVVKEQPNSEVNLPKCSAASAPIMSRRKMAAELLSRITFDPKIFGGKPIVRGRRLAVEHVLGMLEAGDSPETILEGYSWLEPEDIRACIAYARRLVGHERIELLP